MRAIIIRPSKPRLACALIYHRLTKRPAVFACSPVAMIDCPEPTLPGPHWVKVRSRLGGICGSDLKTLRVKISPRSASLANRSPGEPIRFQGHETVGEVIEVGSGVNRFKVGDRAIMIPGTHCAALERDQPCRHCQAGAYCLCDHRETPLHAQPLGGGWSETFVRHETQLHLLNDALSDEQAVLFDPLACSLHAVLRNPPEKGDRVLIIGGGTIGLGIVKMLRALGREINIIVMARHAFQKELATRFGADAVIGIGPGDPYEDLAAHLDDQVVGARKNNRLLRRGVDVIYDAVGSAATLHFSMRTVRAGGTVVLEGADLIPGTLDRTPLWFREINIVGSNGHGSDQWDGRKISTFDRLSDWITEGRIQTDAMISHRYPLGEFQQAMTTAASKSKHCSVKVVFDFNTQPPVNP